MEKLILALFEGALVFDAGVPVRQMYDRICEAHRSDDEVLKVFDALKLDWDGADSSVELKMISPFKEREAQDPDYLICSAYTQLAAQTSMVNICWKNCGYAYLLKKHLLHCEADPMDVKFARETLGVLPFEHRLIDYLLSIPAGPLWTRNALAASDESIKFEEWAEARSIVGAPSVLPSKKVIEQEGERIGYRKIIEDAQNQWDLFSTVLSKI